MRQDVNKQNKKGKACQTRKSRQENMTDEREIDLLIRRVRDFMLRRVGELWLSRELGAFICQLGNVVFSLMIFFFFKERIGRKEGRDLGAIKPQFLHL